MTDREKLIELLSETGMIENKNRCEIIADELIAHGVTVAADNPVGDKFAKDTNVLTNADRVRAMSDDDLAYWIMCPHDHICKEDRNCIDCTKEWLQQPAEG